MKRWICLALCCIAIPLFFAGCYVYTDNPPPRPAIVINPPVQDQQQQQQQAVEEPERIPPPMPPYGAVGRPVH